MRVITLFYFRGSILFESITLFLFAQNKEKFWKIGKIIILFLIVIETIQNMQSCIWKTGKPTLISFPISNFPLNNINKQTRITLNLQLFRRIIYSSSSNKMLMVSFKRNNSNENAISNTISKDVKLNFILHRSQHRWTLGLLLKGLVTLLDTFKKWHLLNEPNNA